MTERSTKDIIKDMREIVKPFISDCLKRVNYEGKGDTDKAEFEKEFEKVLTLAEKAETLSENKGEWISHYDEDTKEGWYECSCCHSERAFNTNYCPDCGADMREPKEEKSENV